MKKGGGLSEGSNVQFAISTNDGQAASALLVDSTLGDRKTEACLVYADHHGPEKCTPETPHQASAELPIPNLNDHNCQPWTGRLEPFMYRLNEFGLLSLADAELARNLLPLEWGDHDHHAHVTI